MKYLLSLFVLWRCVPLLLNFFNVRHVWQDVDRDDKPIVPGSGVSVMGSHRVFVSTESAALAGAAVAYSLHNVLFD